MKLLGAKEFLKTVKPCTLCVEFWESNEEDCLKIIEDFKNGVNIIDKYYGEFYLFGDNFYSLSFLARADLQPDDIVTIKGKDYNCIFIYDQNIVGDASPSITLQLVFENEDEWPDVIKVRPGNELLYKQDILNIRDWFLENESFQNAEGEDYEWIWEFLEKHYSGNKIVNYK